MERPLVLLWVIVVVNLRYTVSSFGNGVSRMRVSP